MLKKINCLITLCVALCITACATTQPPKLVSDPDVYPVYQGCESVDQSQMINCFSKKVIKLFRRKFNTNVASDNGLTGKLRSKVKFVINADGEIDQINVNAPHPALEAEIIRVINEIPALTPGIHEGKRVSVPFSFPFVFSIH